MVTQSASWSAFSILIDSELLVCDVVLEAVDGLIKNTTRSEEVSKQLLGGTTRRTRFVVTQRSVTSGFSTTEPSSPSL